jgi:hypothetical protein
MPFRHAVLPNAPTVDPHLLRPTPSESTLIGTLQVLILNSLNGDYVFDTEACYGRETVAGEVSRGSPSGPADPVIMRVG